MMAILKQLGDAFEKRSGVTLDVLPSLGTTGGLRALSDGVIEIAATARPLKPDELDQGLRPVLTGVTAFVLVTSQAAPGELHRADIAAMISGPKAVWADGTPVRFIIRPRSDADTTLMSELFPGAAQAIERARRLPENPVAGSDAENAEFAESLPGSLAGATYLQMIAERRNVRFVAIDGISPTPDVIERGQYPFSKTLHVIVRRDANKAVERFVAFLRTPEASAIMRRAGLFPQ